MARRLFELPLQGPHFRLGRHFAAPEDVALGPDGASYFTDPQRAFPPRAPALGANLIEGAGVYRVAADLSAIERLACPEISTLGGLALSADGRQF